ncbi:MAG TPA: hypothetical protein VFZ97_10245 [Acidimicrobiales bacterium]
MTLGSVAGIGTDELTLESEQLQACSNWWRHVGDSKITMNAPDETCRTKKGTYPYSV